MTRYRSLVLLPFASVLAVEDSWRFDRHVKPPGVSVAALAALATTRPS